MRNDERQAFMYVILVFYAIKIKIVHGELRNECT